MSTFSEIKFDVNTNQNEIERAVKEWAGSNEHEIVNKRFFGWNHSEAFFLIKYRASIEIMFFWRGQMNGDVSNSVEWRTIINLNSAEDRLILETAKNVFAAITRRLD